MMRNKRKKANMKKKKKYETLIGGKRKLTRREKLLTPDNTGWLVHQMVEFCKVQSLSLYYISSLLFSYNNLFPPRIHLPPHW